MLKRVDPIVKTISQDLLYDQVGDNNNLLEEDLMNKGLESAIVPNLQSNDNKRDSQSIKSAEGDYPVYFLNIS